PDVDAVSITAVEEYGYDLSTQEIIRTVGKDNFLMKLDGDGDVQWVSTWGGSEEMVAAVRHIEPRRWSNTTWGTPSIAVGPDGDGYVTTERPWAIDASLKKQPHEIHFQHSALATR